MASSSPTEQPAEAALPPQPPSFLDVEALLHLSEPRPRPRYLGTVVALFLGFILAGAITGGGGSAKLAIEVLSLVTLLGLMISLSVLATITATRNRERQEFVDGIEELVQLRRWDDAAMATHHFLLEPARSQRQRVRVLALMTTILARYGRFEDALTVQNYLLSNELVDDLTGYGLRLGRAMAMLRQDHLVDADRAMSELRRASGRANFESGGLALVEIYRDVKTGHPDEAIEIFHKKLPALRRQLGHRISDAYGLVARAYDMLGQTVEAQSAYTKATLLQPPGELTRRYPEVAAIAEKYQPALAPREAA